MQLQNIYFIAEIIGVVALVVSLIFVGIQVRQNTAASRVSNAQSAIDAWMNVTMNIARDNKLSRAIADDIHPELRDSLMIDSDSDDDRRVFFWAVTSLKVIEGNYLQWRDGNLSDELWHGFREGLVENFTVNQIFTRIWEIGAANYSSPFQELVKGVRLEAEARRTEILKQV